MVAGDGPMPFKDDAANFGGICSRAANPKLLCNVLLKRVLAIIVLQSARNASPAGVVAGPHPSAFQRHSRSQVKAWRPVPQTVARWQRHAPEPTRRFHSKPFPRMRLSV